MATATSDVITHERRLPFSFADVTPSRLFKALGSLKFTVFLFAMSLIIVLVGTLAQDELNMQEVKERYFLSWLAPMHLDDWFPQAFLRHEQPIPGVIYVPGGALIGALLMVNLLAAKITRFRFQASGTKLMAGLAFLLAGVGLAGFIVFLGHNDDGLQGTPPMSYEQLWALVLATMAVCAVGCVMAASSAKTRVMSILGWALAAGLAIWVVYSLVSGTRISDPGLRIVWQLAKGLGAGLVMLVGCQLAFGKQGGNVLLHLGVGLLMVGQFAFGDRQMEQRLSLVEGQSTNTFVNLDEIELQFIRSDDDSQTVTAVPVSRLLAVAGQDKVIFDEALPVKLRVHQYFPNAKLMEAPETNQADTGTGLEVAAVELERSGGADMSVNLPAAYVELIDKESEESLGIYLVANQLNDREILMPGVQSKDMLESVTVGEQEYRFGLRLHREVKPYWVQLDDVRRVNYSGTDTPRDYSSFIRIVDEQTGEDRKERVWMNNPLRFRGETFYQSNYTALPGGKELTGIQVVRNSGWLIPYVACSITGLGMLVHFWGTLTRFISRRRRETARLAKQDPFDADENALSESTDADDIDSGVVQGTTQSDKRMTAGKIAATLWVSAMAALALYCLLPAQSLQNMRRPTDRDLAFDFESMGRIPVQFGGRVMPVDAYARQTLKAMTNKDSLPLEKAPSKIRERVDGKKMSAVQWLMEVAVDQQEISRLPMFRIDAEEIRAELDLDRRESKLYSIDDLSAHMSRIMELGNEARAKEPIDQTFKDKKVIELNMRLQQYLNAAEAFQLPIPREFPEDFFPEGTSEQTRQLFALRDLQDRMQKVSQRGPAGLIPPASTEAVSEVDQPDWDAFAPAFFEMARNGLKPDEARAGIASFGEMIRSYNREDAAAFNKAVDDHLAAVNSYQISGYDHFAVSLERWLGSASPTAVATGIYILAIILGLIALAFDSPRLNDAVWGTVAVAFIVHTIVIAARVYITGRAPVINLYSSAVFIGWAAVLFGLVVERIFKYGTGNLLAAFAGMMTLRVAYNLTLNVGQAETMGVLQAVLDTQFWLTTHVISVSLGYVATMVAGFLGIGYLIATWAGASDTARRDLYRVLYGASCFGILFSFIGTVLGGLWADDSWGRFWGWDPKENGALLIVIWNALMLHARWDGMVQAKGFALLAIGGNIITAWSWFGTNELGIGLHSYGFTEGMLFRLAIFFFTQLAFIAAGLLIPTSRKMSSDV